MGETSLDRGEPHCADDDRWLGFFEQFAKPGRRPGGITILAALLVIVLLSVEIVMIPRRTHLRISHRVQLRITHMDVCCGPPLVRLLASL